jgi:hypothetical protein
MLRRSLVSCSCYNGGVKPGKPLEVRKEQDSITIVMDVAPATSRTPIRLVLRCERDGQIYASIDRGPARPAD